VKKVAIVLNSPWQGYNFRLNLARELKYNNYDVSFITSEDGEYSPKLKKEFNFVNANFNAKTINPFEDLKLCLSLYKAFKTVKPDIVLNFTIKPNIYGSIISKILKIPSINNITGLGTVFIKKSFITKVVKLLYKVSLYCSDFIFFQNSDDQQLFIDFNLASLKKSALLPGSGVDTKKFSSQGKKNWSTFRFLMVARLIKDKGVYEFIEAAKLLKDDSIEFWILGEREVANKTAIGKDEIANLSKQKVVNFFDRTDDVKSFLDTVDCVVLPSYREGSPRCIMEASSVELPVIVSDVPGCRQVVDNNITGFYCRARDSQDLLNKMKSILKMTNNERKRMGHKGRQKMIKEYDESIVIESYKQKINEIFNQNIL
jgi:glycosyltransferase involved in cell wall biosynthesis